MSLIWTRGGPYRRVEYQNEADLEASITQVQTELFGFNRIYLDIKKKIGVKGGLRNIPDGYLLDLSSRKPRLYVVENELASHDPLRHIAVQILEFSLSFETDQRAVKAILFNALQDQPTIKHKCEEYAANHEFRNLDHMLEYLVFESPFAAIVIIDEMPDSLENVLARKFQFGVEVLELARYEGAQGERFYLFELSWQISAKMCSSFGRKPSRNLKGPIWARLIPSSCLLGRTGFRRYSLARTIGAQLGSTEPCVHKSSISLRIR